MSLLEVENLSHGFGEKNLFSKIDFRLLDGEHIGLVGINGAGKSTLMKILAGQDSPDMGTIKWIKNVKFGYLEQHINFSPTETIQDYLRNSFAELFDIEKSYMEVARLMETAQGEDLESLYSKFNHFQNLLDINGFYYIDKNIEEVSSGLGINSLGMDTPVNSLSGGQRTKLLLTRLLLQKPDVLLLDEPTNYLDDDHIAWLRNFLQNYKQSYIVISHDIDFLNAVTTIIYHIENKALTRYVGNYTKFLEAYELRSGQQLSAFKSQQAEIKKMETYIQKNIARSSTSKSAKSRVKKLEKMELIEAPTKAPKPKFRFKAEPNMHGVILKTTNLVVGYNKPLLPSVNLTMKSGEKVALVGYNGIGKSSSLKTILGLIKPFSGTVELGDKVHPYYFAQEENLTSDISALDSVWNDFPNLTQKDVRAALAQSGLSSKHIMQSIRSLSGGEQSKVRLCKLMLSKSNWLILDEPTNHLDTNAKESLKKALIDYKGTLLLVSHEPSFYEGWVTNTWNVEDWI